MKRDPIKFFELNFLELTTELKRRFNRGHYHAAALFREIYKKGKTDPSRAPEFVNSKSFWKQLHSDLEINLYPVTRTVKEKDTIKFVTRLSDGLEIESVIVPMATHCTVCISSQVGCAMGCRFCETATMGFIRNLTVEEIIGQIYSARFYFCVNIRNVVFMGMGEPLNNLDNVIRSIRVMEDQRGLDIPKRYISVSTCGLVPGIQKIAKLNWPQLNLAVSLNAPNDRIRSSLMPVNSIWPMLTLREALLNFPMKKNGALYIEYVLIKNINDQRDHAHQLAQYLKPLKAKLNLIPYNSRRQSLFLPPSPGETSRFLYWLVQENIFVRKRSSKGQDIMAGCGQLCNAQRSRSYNGPPKLIQAFP